MTTGTLYLVATPIGHLDDMSSRAVETLKQVDRIAAEDTRHSLALLRHFGIQTRCQSYHAHNESEQSSSLISHLQNGESIALISDAGTPLISDPGCILVRKAHEAGIPVCPIPGPCAAIAALSASGLSTTDFRFVGFLTAKGEKRQRELEQLCQQPETIILYESVHRIANLVDTLHDLMDGSRQVCLAREITKRFEQIKTAPIADIHRWFWDHPDTHKGEYVVIIEGAVAQADTHQITQTLDILLAELPVKKAAEVASKLTGERKNKLYELALNLKKT